MFESDGSQHTADDPWLMDGTDGGSNIKETALAYALSATAFAKARVRSMPLRQ
jgi:hypothetical protein